MKKTSSWKSNIIRLASHLKKNKRQRRILRRIFLNQQSLNYTIIPHMPQLEITRNNFQLLPQENASIVRTPNIFDVIFSMEK